MASARARSVVKDGLASAASTAATRSSSTVIATESAGMVRPVLDDLPRVPLASVSPTPLEPLDRLGGALGLEPGRLWVKRDDLNGLGGGGNKVRKLEFLPPDAPHPGGGGGGGGGAGRDT